MAKGGGKGPEGELAEPGSDEGGSNSSEPEVDTDPYRLKNVDRFRPSKSYKYKRKVLVFGNRGLSQLGAHLLKDLKSLLPHHKSEVSARSTPAQPKWESKMGYREINELCEINRCSAALYLESRKNEMILWIARSPQGPTLKSRVTNIHTLKDSTFLGNCLARSRPILTFDASFAQLPHLRLLQSLLAQTLGTPNNHPKSMPFHDHCLSFFHLANRIFIRHYQVAPENEFALNSPENQTLTEIGPQFVLEPILILEGSFSGITLWRSAKYISPLMVRRYQRLLKLKKFRARAKPKVGRAPYSLQKELKELPEDELSVSNVFAAP